MTFPNLKDFRMSFKVICLFSMILLVSCLLVRGAYSSTYKNPDTFLESILTTGVKPPNANRIDDKGGEEIYRSGGNNPEIPYVISPRYTAISNVRPKLRWHDTGADYYGISICKSDGRDHFSKQDCTDPSIILKRGKDFYSLNKFGINIAVANYPYSSEELDRDTWYYLYVVEKAGGKNVNSDEDLPTNQYPALEKFPFGGIGFMALPVDLNRTYIDNNQYEFVVSLLEKTSDLYKNDLIYQQLGVLYTRGGLNCLAKGAYKNALENLSSIQNSNIQQRKKSLETSLNKLGETYCK